MSHREAVEYTCDFCERQVVTTLEDPEGWYTIFYSGSEEANFCSIECLCKQYQPAPATLDGSEYAF